MAVPIRREPVELRLFSVRSACLLAIETHQLFIFGALSATWRLRLAQAQMLSVNERGASAAAQEPIDEETSGKCRLFSRGAPHGGRDTGPIIRAFAFTRESKYSFSNCLLWKGLASKSSSVRAGGGGARTGLFVFFPIASPTRACVAPSSSAPSRPGKFLKLNMFKRRVQTKCTHFSLKIKRRLRYVCTGVNRKDTEKDTDKDTEEDIVHTTYIGSYSLRLDFSGETAPGHISGVTLCLMLVLGLI